MAALQARHKGAHRLMGNAAKAAVAPIVGGKEHLVILPMAYGNRIVRIALVGRKVKGKQQSAPLKGDNVLVLMHGMGGTERYWLVDEQVCVENVTRFANASGYTVTVTRDGDDFRMELKK